ncbi:alpha/beta fold hydrolase [Streptomyces sp. NPDC056716]|uniref:alpha/beta fold hydrolase n=1 Tax=unclassified Streptomyces TaxID=2593676 RepID=UPI00369C481D
MGDESGWLVHGEGDAHQPHPQGRFVEEKANNVVRWSDFDRGGHFTAMEAPDLLLDDIRAFFADHR